MLCTYNNDQITRAAAALAAMSTRLQDAVNRAEDAEQREATARTEAKELRKERDALVRMALRERRLQGQLGVDNDAAGRPRGKSEHEVVQDGREARVVLQAEAPTRVDRNNALCRKRRLAEKLRAIAALEEAHAEADGEGD